MRGSRLARRAAMVIFILALAACVSTLRRGSTALLDFLKDGETTREQVFLELGEPSAVYDNSRIATYWLNRDEGGYYLVRNLSRDWNWAAYSLVLVFSDNGALKSRSIVTLNSRGSTTLLDFLKDGQTTREQIFLELGEPSAVYENSRIATYRLTRDKAGYYLVRNLQRDWSTAAYSLVLVFDDNGALKSRSLVTVKK